MIPIVLVAVSGDFVPALGPELTSGGDKPGMAYLMLGEDRGLSVVADADVLGAELLVYEFPLEVAEAGGATPTWMRGPALLSG